MELGHYMSSKSGEVLIYESPDGGRTVWARHMGELVRRKVSENLENSFYNRVNKWQDILLLAKSDTDLNQAIEHVETLYELRKPR